MKKSDELLKNNICAGGNHGACPSDVNGLCTETNKPCDLCVENCKKVLSDDIPSSVISESSLRELIVKLECAACTLKEYQSLPDVDSVLEAIKLLQSLADNNSKPEIHAHWIPNTDDFTPANRCSNCGANIPCVAHETTEADNKKDKYCKCCGATMNENY